MKREELEYYIESDTETYGRAYVTNPDSRWNTPEFAALATDAVPAEMDELDCSADGRSIWNILVDLGSGLPPP